MADRIGYFELFAADLKQSAQFYHELFDWQLTESGPEYMMIKIDGGIGGGLFSGNEPGERIHCYIEVADIEARLAQITAAGGTVVTGKTLISEKYGYYALFRDPAGNLLGLVSAN
ncbi:VOC family protein [bacterium]|nr:VOC family protein [bacterium]